MNEFNLSLIIKLIKLYKKKIIKITLSIMIITVIFSFIMPYTYSVEAILMPPKKEKSSGGLSSFLQSFSGGGLSLASVGKSNQSKLYAAMLSSRTVVEYTIRKNNLDSSKYFDDTEHYKIVKQLREEITSDVGKNGLIQLEFGLQTSFFASSEEKKEVAILAADIVNYAVEGLDSVLRAQSMISANLSKTYIVKELDKYYIKLDSIEAELEAYQSQNNVLEIEEQLKAIMEQAVTTGAELSIADAEYRIANAEFNSDAPQLKVAREKYESLAEQYKNIQTGGLFESDKFSISLDKMPKIARKYATLLRDQKIMQEVMLYLETQRHQEGIAANRNVPTVDVLDMAVVPEKQSAPSKKMMLLLSIILGFIFAVIYILFDVSRKGILEEKN